MTVLKVTADPLMRPVRAFSAHDRSVTHAEGICVAVADFPTLTIRDSLGNTISWAAHLCEVTGEVVSERPGEPETWGIVEASCVHSDSRREWVKHPDGNWWVAHYYGDEDYRPNPDDWDSLVDPKVIRDGVTR